MGHKLQPRAIMRFAFCCVFLLFSTLFCEQNIYQQASNYGDPSSIINGCVSAITGKLCRNEVDLTVKGEEPIEISRYYMQSHRWNGRGGWRFGKPCKAIYYPRQESFQVEYDRGLTLIFYLKESRKSIKKLIAQKKPIPLKLSKRPLNVAMSNTAMHQISARTNLYNVRAEVSHDQNWLRLYLPDGQQRDYESIKRTRNCKIKVEYRLIKEVKANGNVLLHKYNSYGQLREISSLSPDEKITYAWARYQFHANDQSDDYTIICSDGQKREYRFRGITDSKTGKKGLFLSNYISYKDPHQDFEYHSAHSLIKANLASIKMPDGRHLSFEYENHRRVHKILAPHDPDTPSFALQRFEYKKRATNVFNAHGDRTRYTYNKNKRLTHIHRYQGTDKLLNVEQFTWGNGDGLDASLLKVKTFFDRHNNPIYSRLYIYDERGNPIEERLYGNITGRAQKLKIEQNYPAHTSADVAVTKRQFAHNNLLLQETDPNGLTTLIQYLNQTDKIKRRLYKAKNKIIKREFFVYDSHNRLIEEIVDNGSNTQIEILSNVTYRLRTQYTLKETQPFIGMPKTITKSYLDPVNGSYHLLSIEKLTYDCRGNITKRTLIGTNNQKHITTHQNYNARGLVKQSIDPLGHQSTYQYDSNNNLVLEHCKDNTTKKHRYDLQNRLIQTTHQKRVTSYTYHTNSKLKTQTNHLGNTTKYTYDALGNCIQKTGPPSPTPAITTIAYSDNSHPIKTTDANGNSKTVINNIFGKPLKIIHADNTCETFTYDLSNNLTTHIKQNGTKYAYTYDIFHRKLSESIIKACGQVVSKTTYKYDAFNLLQKTDPEGNMTLYTYDGAGRKICEESHFKDGNHEKTTFEYDDFNRHHKTLYHDTDNPLLELKIFDKRGQTIETRHLGLDGKLFDKTRYEYDVNGNVAKTIRYIGHKNIESIETSAYDPFNRLIAHQDPLGNTTTIQYIETDHTQKITTNPKGLKTIETFDARGNITVKTLQDLNSQTLHHDIFCFDLNNNKISHTATIFLPNATRQTTTNWDYDSKNRIITLVEAANSPKMRTSHMTYTSTGQIASITKPSKTTLNHTYDPLDRLKTLTSSDQSIDYSYTYNKLSQVISVFDAIHKTMSHFKWNPKGRLLYEKLANNLEIQNSYDLRGRRTTCILPAGRITYTYNPAHLKSITRYNSQNKPLYTHTYEQYDLSGNLLKATAINGDPITYTHNIAGLRTEIQTPYFAHTIKKLDPNNNVLKAVNNQISETYKYNLLDQLTDEPSNTYDYDSQQNRLTHNQTTYQVNALNQLSHITYDLDGNPTKIGSKNLSYDALGRLIALDGDTYTYDHLHRRMTTSTQRFLYDDQNEIGTDTELRILGIGQGAEIGASIAIELNTHQEIYTPIHDLYGNVKMLSSFGHTQTYTYTAFGEHHTNSTNSWRYQSKRSDPTGLIYFGRRYYDPSMGRFLTPDPLGLSEHPNLYQYIQNNPLLNFDKYGLSQETVKPTFVNNEIGQFKSANYSLNLPPPPSGAIGFTNGIMTRKKNAFAHAIYISNLANGINIEITHNATHGLRQDLNECIYGFNGIATAPVKNLYEKWVGHFAKAGPDSLYFEICHSQGAIITHLALSQLPKHLQNRIIVLAIAPAKYISRQKCLEAYNYVSKRDFVEVLNNMQGIPDDTHIEILAPHPSSTSLGPRLSKSYLPIKSHWASG